MKRAKHGSFYARGVGFRYVRTIKIWLQGKVMKGHTDVARALSFLKIELAFLTGTSQILMAHDLTAEVWRKCT
jgi:hypothetical protein